MFFAFIKKEGRKQIWNKKQIILYFFLAGMILSAVSVSLWCYHYDNKYTYPRPAAANGVVNLDMNWYDEESFFYLVDGWEFYHGNTLSPGQPPDRYLYIGRYGGFDLGDPKANPHGSGIYRIVIVTDAKEREYAMELPQIYSRWNLWINGRLMQSVGIESQPEGEAGASDVWNPFEIPTAAIIPDTAGSLVTFRARDRIEIVVAAADDSHFYSGMVYPPAFGSPGRVGRVSSGRLLIHGGVSTVSVMMAILCLLLGWGCRFRRPYGAVALLFLCEAGSTSWPVFQALKFTGDGWYLLERFCYYGIFLLIIWIQGRICLLPKKVIWPACAMGLLVLLSILIQPMIPVSQAAVFINYSLFLSSWKWLTAVWLIATGIWSLCQKRQYAGPMMGGSCILACFLVMEKLLPAHEPVYTGWFVELAGLAILLLMTGILWYDTILLYKESVELRLKQALAQIQLEAREEQADLQQEYVRSTRKLLHESRHRLTLIRHYLDAGELNRLSVYLNSLTADMSNLNSCVHTGNTLVDALIAPHLSRADQMGIYVELELCDLPKALPIADDDFTLILMNLLDNAEESCLRFPREDRWIHLKIDKRETFLEITCTNTAVFSSAKGKLSESEEMTCKSDKLAHGYGLTHIREAAARYGGRVDLERMEDSFRVSVVLECAVRDVP